MATPEAEAALLRLENDQLRTAHQLEIESMKRQAVVLATQNDRLRAERDRLITFAKEVGMLLSLHASDASFYVTPGHHEAHEWWQGVLGGELRRLPEALRR